jgi:hypothetical protein
MLTIKKTQIEFFEASQEIESANRLREYFMKTFGELSRQHPERLEVEAIRRSLTKARQYDFCDDEQMGKFALLSFVLGEDFDLDPRNHVVLTETLWHPATRLDHIIGWIEMGARKADQHSQGQV